MLNSTTFDLQELDKYITEKCGGKEFYLGCWSPDIHEFTTSNVPEYMEIAQGSNWIAIRNGADQTDGILFPSTDNTGPELIVFRGYHAEAELHSYSNRDEVREYWSQDMVKRHNGVFCAIRIAENGAQLSIVTDIFGMGPVYIREEGDLVFFSSAPALLSFKDDVPDRISWVMRLLCGYVPGRGSLTERIELAEEASVTTYSSSGKSVRKWYEYEKFPKECKAVDEQSLELSEEKLRTAISRCQKIQFGDAILPLSSGYDSRRLFAHLESRGTSFEICTVQSLLEGGEDVESSCAVQIAEDYRIDYNLFELPQPDEWYSQDVRRIFTMDGQCQDHTWSVQIFSHYGNQKCSFYDGTGGDIFGFNDWVFEGHLNKAIPNKFPGVLKKDCFPDIERIKSELYGWKAVVPNGANENMLAFALWQTRKSSVAWSQQQAQPGQLLFYPYLDLDYIELMLNYANERNVVNRPQKRILYKYWPALAKYRGTREMPKKANNLITRRVKNKNYTQKRVVSEALSIKKQGFDILGLYQRAARYALFLSQYIAVKRMPDWWLKPTAEMLLWWNSRPSIISTNRKKSDN